MKGKIEQRFLLSNVGSSIRTEFIAGFTTFVTMAYVMATVPNMLSDTGMGKGAILTSMIILIVLTTAAMGFFSNLPFALGPGLGSVAVVAGMISTGVSKETAAGIIFWGGILFVFISYVGLRDAVVKAIPASLKHAVAAGVGFLIALIGAKSAGLVVANANKNVLNIGDVTQPAAICALIGLVIILIFKAKNVPGYMILSILITTVVGIPLKVTVLPDTLLRLPDSPFTNFLHMDIFGALKVEFLPFFMALFMTDFFSTFGTAYGVGARAGLVDQEGNLPGIDRVFKVDALSTVGGSLFGMPCMTTYLESSAGVEAGGKTGLTAIFTGVFFAAALFLSPIALVVPAAATAPALMMIGIDMLASLKNLKFSDFSEYFPALLCVAVAILSNSIADGICFAILAYVILKITAGKMREMPKSTAALVAMALLYIGTTYIF